MNAKYSRLAIAILAVMRRIPISCGLVFLSLTGGLLAIGGCLPKEVEEDLVQMANTMAEHSRVMLVHDGRYLIEWEEPLWSEPSSEGSDFKSPLDKPYYQSFDSWLALSHPIAELREELTAHRTAEAAGEPDDRVFMLQISPLKEEDIQQAKKIGAIVDECGYIPSINKKENNSYPAWWND